MAPQSPHGSQILAEPPWPLGPELSSSSNGHGKGFRFRVQGLGSRVQGLGFRVQGLGVRV